MEEYSSIKLPIDNEILKEYYSNLEDFSALLRYYYDDQTNMYSLEACFNSDKNKELLIDCKNDEFLFYKLAINVLNACNCELEEDSMFTSNCKPQINTKLKSVKFIFDEPDNDKYFVINSKNKIFLDKLFRILDNTFNELSKGCASKYSPKEKD